MFKNINSNAIRLSQRGARIASPFRHLLVRVILAVLLVAMISAAGFVRPRIGIAFQGAGEATIRTFTLPIANTGPAGLIQGPDDNLWICLIVANKIARMTPTGTFTLFDVPTPNSVPFLITEGPDGALWFTEQAGKKIGRITTSGTITEFTVPTAGSQPTDITAGPDGNLWFTEIAGNKIGRITPSGVITEFPLPTPARNPGGIAAGPDDALYFTEVTGNKIGRITTSGVITEFDIPTRNSFPTAITQGPDGHLWFVETAANKLGRFSPFFDEASAAIAPASSPELHFQEFPNPAPGAAQSLTFYKGSFYVPGPIGSKMAAFDVLKLNYGATISLPSGSTPNFVKRYFDELAVSLDGANAIALVTPTSDFDYCIKDDNTGDLLKFNSKTGEYMAQFRGKTQSGTGQVPPATNLVLEIGAGQSASIFLKARPRVGVVFIDYTYPLTGTRAELVILDTDIDNNICAPDNFETFTALMSPANVVPPLASNNPEGNASAEVVATFSVTPGLNGPLAGSSFVTFNLAGFPNTSRVTGAHIHIGAASQNGQSVYSPRTILENLTGVDPGVREFENPFVISQFLNSFAPSPPDPISPQAASAFYFDIHTELNKTGAIRGQLMLGPKLFGAEVDKKKLIVYGEGFEPGAKILLNGEQQKTTNDEQSPTQILIAKKSGKKIAPGQEVTLQLRQPNGAYSNEKAFIRPE